jgi:methionyl-tRNA formyltransferase
MEAIYEAGYELDTIFTLKDDMAVGKSGRIFVDEFAQQHGVAVHKLRHVNDADAVEKYRNLDWLFIIGWSQIAGPEVINAPKNGVLGIHPTLLPEGRGRAAIPWAILKGLTKTGITLFKLDEGVDTGPVLAQIEIPLDDQTTATNLYERVSAAHGDLMREVLPKLRSGKVQLHFQDESKATVWPGRCPEDGEILTAGSVRDAARLVRAVTPFQITWSSKMGISPYMRLRSFQGLVSRASTTQWAKGTRRHQIFVVNQVSLISQKHIPVDD